MDTRDRSIVQHWWGPAPIALYRQVSQPDERGPRRGWVPADLSEFAFFFCLLPSVCLRPVSAETAVSVPTTPRQPGCEREGSRRWTTIGEEMLPSELLLLPPLLHLLLLLLILHPSPSIADHLPSHAENPRVTNRCTRCKNKLDFGDEYICCTDCSDPYLIDKNTKLGYCKTGAELAVQLKPHGSYHCISYPLFLCHHDGIDIQGFPYRSIPPAPGGTYRLGYRYADRPLPGGNRPSAVDFDHRRSIEGEKGKKKKRKRRKKKRRRRIPRAVLTRTPSPLAGCPRPVLARTLSLPAGDFSPVRGERSRRCSPFFIF
ncbi:hypothetical protein BHM03_00060939 [Ensete ventricosum]|nr:hypothetical protein BHM03_00060939 [Ensete ventricosum]